MSVKAMSIVWESDLDKREKFVLLAYADHANDEGGDVFPSYGKVAWKTGYSRRQVIRVTQDLEKRGYITDVGISKYQTTEYKINLKKLIPLEPYVTDKENKSASDKMSPAKKSASDICDTGGDILTPGYRESSVKMSPDPSLINHQETIIIENGYQLTHDTVLSNGNCDEKVRQLIALFTDQTAFFPPHDTTDEYKEKWYLPMERLYTAFPLAIEKRIIAAIKKLRENRYTIKSPASIYVAAANLQPEHEQNKQQTGERGWFPT